MAKAIESSITAVSAQRNWRVGAASLPCRRSITAVSAQHHCRVGAASLPCRRSVTAVSAQRHCRVGAVSLPCRRSVTGMSKQRHCRVGTASMLCQQSNTLVRITQTNLYRRVTVLNEIQRLMFKRNFENSHFVLHLNNTSNFGAKHAINLFSYLHIFKDVINRGITTSNYIHDKDRRY